MAQVTLLPHNEIGHAKLVDCLEENQIATLNHATGTGKSFITLKYLYEHKDKRILVLAPTYPILEQWKYDHMEELGISLDEFKKFDTMIYSNLLKIDDMKKLAEQYDIVVFDEYHRCGSEKWGQKVKELKEALLADSDKRVIGTTATEIRYLDNERNMKNILFDGIEASRLTLADAILQGILPAPYYINCDLEVIEKIDNIIKRVKKYLPDYVDEKESILKELIELRVNYEKELLESDEIRKYIKEGEKYLAFSSTKDSIPNDRKRIMRFFNNQNVNDYVVHSGQTKEKNSLILDTFKKIKNGLTSILYSIGILNEGVHVKDIYGIFMCRKTTSPIIYFQQLGRLLSFSRRKDQVVVFDLVGNLKNHKVIYNLYNEVIERAKKLIETDPENKERYQAIINNFKIIDKAGEVFNKINELNEKYSKENLIKMTLNKDVELLESKTKLPYMNLYRIKNDINRYYKYIDINLFSRLKKFKSIFNLNLLNLSVEEFSELLNGYENINELKNNKYKILFKNVKEFIDNKYVIPSIFSDEEEELALALELQDNFKKLKGSNQKYIRESIDDSISLYEKISYGLFIDDVNIDELLDEISYIMSMKIAINKNVLNYLKYLVLKNEIKDIVKVSEIIRKIERYNKFLILKNYDEEDNENSIEDYVELEVGITTNEMRKTIDELSELIEKEGIEKVLETKYLEIIEFIKKYGYIPIYRKKDSNTNKEVIESNRLYFILKVLEKGFDIYGYTDKIENILLDVKVEAMDKVVDQIIEFIEKNDNILPSSKSNDPYEKQLAYYFHLIRKQNKYELYQRLIPYVNKYNELKEEFLQHMSKLDETIDEKEASRKFEKFKKLLTFKEITIVRQAIYISKIINFMLSHNYEFPSKDNPSMEEKNLAHAYSYFKRKMTPEQFALLSKYMAKQKEYKEIFVKKYTSYVEKNGIIPTRYGTSIEYELSCSLTRWEPYMTREEINNLKYSSVVKCITRFMKEHNYEMPSSKNPSRFECSIAYSFSRVKNRLDDKNKSIINEYMSHMEEYKKIFLEKLNMYVNEHGHVPSIDDNQLLAESYNRWLPYMTTEEKLIIKSKTDLKDLKNFIINHNYEIPSLKNPTYEEKRLARVFSGSEEISVYILETYKQEFQRAKIEFINIYSAFVNKNKRIPLLSDVNERELRYSYNRWFPYLTKAELKKLEIKNVSKFDAMANAYQAMKKKKM